MAITRPLTSIRRRMPCNIDCVFRRSNLYMAMNDIKTNVDLIGLSIDDLTFDIENEGTMYTLTGGQRAWVRRCIDKANKEFVGKVAERGEVEPARGETSAIKALVETIKNEEVSITTLL